MTDVTISAGDARTVLSLLDDNLHFCCTGGCGTGCGAVARLRNAVRAASSATETPVQPVTGSRDDRTSETPTETRTDAAKRINEYDPRILMLAKTRHAFFDYGKSWPMLGSAMRGEMLNDAWDDLRVAVAAGLVPADPEPAPVLDPADDGHNVHCLCHDDLRAVYRERARLVAYLAVCHPSVIGHNDPHNPEWPVIYVKTTQGQLSWHLSPDDLDLFPHVDVVKAAITWDGHTTEEKYRRLAELTSREAARD